MGHKTINPATHAAGRAGMGIKDFDGLDISSSFTAAAGIPQASIIIAKRYRLEPVIARLVCHLACIGLEA